MPTRGISNTPPAASSISSSSRNICSSSTPRARRKFSTPRPRACWRRRRGSACSRPRMRGAAAGGAALPRPRRRSCGCACPAPFDPKIGEAPRCWRLLARAADLPDFPALAGACRGNAASGAGVLCADSGESALVRLGRRRFQRAVRIAPRAKSASDVRDRTQTHALRRLRRQRRTQAAGAREDSACLPQKSVVVGAVDESHVVAPEQRESLFDRQGFNLALGGIDLVVIFCGMERSDVHLLRRV